jgi:electron transfer flavoprotein alpha subunit
MAQPILVFIEERQGSVKKASLEALAHGRKLADILGESVVAFWAGPAAPPADLAHYGGDRICWARHTQLETYSTEAYSAALHQVTRDVRPRLILASATAMGKDLLPRLAARLGAGLAQDCTVLRLLDDGQVECVRPIYAGKAFARVRFLQAPAIATLRPNVFTLGAPDAGRQAPVSEISPDLGPDDVHARCTGLAASGGDKVELTEADIIVSGGRGLKGPENFSIIQDLADALGGAMGASRAAVDAGWIDHQHQVGQTGKTVSPTLYVACGISGAIQHLAGMSSSKYIVAINKDPEAPIFKVADYGIVGDLFAVVPALTQEVRKLKSR